MKIIKWYKPVFGWVELPMPIKLSNLVQDCVIRLGYTEIVLQNNDEILHVMTNEWCC